MCHLINTKSFGHYFSFANFGLFERKSYFSIMSALTRGLQCLEGIFLLFFVLQKHFVNASVLCIRHLHLREQRFDDRLRCL